MYDPELPSEQRSIAPPASPTPQVPPPPLMRPTFYIQMTKPVVSKVIMGVLLAVFALEVVWGVWRYGAWMTFNGTDIRALVDLGAKVNVYVASGEFWRLFTATLLHDGIIHLLFNLYALFALGPMLESYIGWARFTAIYVLGGLFGSLLSYAFSDSISVGASGAIFGIIGATTVYFFRYRHNFGAQGRAILQNMIVVIAINLVFGFSSGFIDNWGHIGGLLGGAIVAIGLVPRYAPPEVVRLGQQPLQEVDRRGWEIAWVVGCSVVFVIGVLLVTSTYYQAVQQMIGQ